MWKGLQLSRVFRILMNTVYNHFRINSWNESQSLPEHISKRTKFSDSRKQQNKKCAKRTAYELIAYRLRADGCQCRPALSRRDCAVSESSFEPSVEAYSYRRHQFYPTVFVSLISWCRETQIAPRTAQHHSQIRCAHPHSGTSTRHRRGYRWTPAHNHDVSYALSARLKLMLC